MNSRIAAAILGEEAPVSQGVTQVGERVHQHGAEKRVRGQAVFTQDFTLDGMLFAAVLRSPHAHALIKSIDVDEALKAPGVRAVITARDFPGIKYVHFGAKYSDRYPLAVDKVRFVGEEVAAIAADTLDHAIAALELIQVEYQPLPVALTPEQAMAAGASAIHPTELTPTGRNIAQERDLDFGDVAKAFSEAAHVFDDVYEHGVVVPACMETNGTVAYFDAAAKSLNLWTATQAPFFIRKEVAHVLDLDKKNVHVHPIEVGGGFGGKSKVCEQEALASLLSIKAGAPVKLNLSRLEEFLSGKTDHAKKMHVKTAVDSQGNILARSTSVVIDNGAYTAFGPVYMAACRARTTSLYRVGAAHYDSKLVYTNKVPGGQYRGMGAPQTIWALESQMDEIAQKLNLDPLEYRIRIANRDGDVTPLGWKITSCALAECLEAVGKSIGWEEHKKKRTPWRGIGFASMIHPSAGVLYEEGNYSNTKIVLTESGRFTLYTQTADTGTWQNTILAQLAAAGMGLPASEVTVIHMDTEAGLPDLGSAASRVTFVTGNSAVRAAQGIQKKIAELAAQSLECEDAQVELVPGHAQMRGNPDRRISLAQLVKCHGPVSFDGFYTVPAERPNPDTGYGNYAAAYSFGAQAVEVEVDPDTGRVKILKIAAALDVGKAINPTAIEGQTHGGIVQGIGMALQEELVYEDNKPVNANFINYKIPRMGDAPPIDVILIEKPEMEGPFGAKAAGEPSINPTVAAVANAVANATGIRFKKLPLSPDVVLTAIKDKAKEKLALKPLSRPHNVHVAAVRALYPKVVFPLLREVGTKFAKLPKKRVAPPRVLGPTSLDELLQTLKSNTGNMKLVAGGTDMFVGLQQGVYTPETLVDLGRIAELKSITESAGHLHLGAGNTLSEVAQSPLVKALLPMLSSGVRRIATQQIRNMATVAGDLCQEKRCWFFRSALPCYKHGGTTCPCFAVMGDSRHHSIIGASRCAAPCPADLAPILTALDAKVIALSVDGLRTIPMEAFYQWSGLTVLQANEVVLRIEIPLLQSATSAFEKFAIRVGDFAEASVAVRLVWDGARLEEARVSLGAVSPLPVRAEACEKQLVNGGTSEQNIREAAAKVVHGSLPLEHNTHKTHLLVELAERAIHAAVSRRNAP